MRRLRPVAAILVVAVCAVYVALGARQPWDFETYFFAAKALREGLDPYRLASLSAAAGRPVGLPFLYPPAILLPFLPLSLLPVEAAGYVWLAIQCLLAIVLVRLWRAHFIPDAPADLLVLTALLGFNAALLWALRTGNLALFEASLLWGGFAALKRGRLSAAAALIALGGWIKVLPLAFLSLVLAAPARARDRARAILVAGLVLAAVSLPHANLLPDWAAAVERSLAAGRPTGEANPSLLGLLDGWTAGGTWLAGPGKRTALGLYAAFGAAILAFSARPFGRLRREGATPGWIMLGVLAWLLISPRVMVYSWVMAVPPAIYVIRRHIGGQPLRSLAYGCVVLQGFARFLPGPPPRALHGLSFFLLLGLWGIAVAAPVASRAGPADKSPHPNR
jgi:hypothetical protein